MANTTLDEEFRKTLKDFAAGAKLVDEPYVLATVRLVADRIDGDEEVWTLTSEEAEKRAGKYRLIAAYAARGAALCDDHANDVRAEPIALQALLQP